MNDLFGNSVVLPFNRERSFVISPIALYLPQNIENDPYFDSPRDKRGNFLCRLHGMLECESFIRYDQGQIAIRALEKEFVKDSNYWGGDGIRLTIPVTYDGQDLSRALQMDWVVFDEVLKKYFLNGLEQTFEQTPKGQVLEPIIS